MSDFSDRPFVAGSLVGVRAFDVDPLGRLVGPTYRSVFAPGENVAACVALGRMNASLARTRSSRGAITATATAAESSEPPEHVVGCIGCSCGYYAYFDGKSDYSQTDRVTALIEGYGVCTVGTRGYRAEKARLVALVLKPERKRTSHPAWFDRYADWLNRTDAGALLGVLTGMVGVFTSVGVIAAGVTDSPRWLLFLIATLSLVMFAAVTLRADFHAIDREFPRVSDLSRCRDQQARRRFDLVRRNYPDSPVYPSLSAAMRAHPLTVPEPPHAPEPDGEDFWTRSAS